LLVAVAVVVVTQVPVVVPVVDSMQHLVVPVRAVAVAVARNPLVVMAVTLTVAALVLRDHIFKVVPAVEQPSVVVVAVVATTVVVVVVTTTTIAVPMPVVVVVVRHTQTQAS
jgi:hypothetical protein